jgi:hypothetical protein
MLNSTGSLTFISASASMNTEPFNVVLAGTFLSVIISPLFIKSSFSD